MKYVLMPLRLLYTVYAFVVFVGLMFIVLPLVLLGSLRGTVRGGNFIYNVCRLWGVAWFTLTGIWHVNRYEAPHDKAGHYIFVANHISYLDIPSLILAIRQPVRVLGKYEMVHYPVFGYIYRCAAILVDRSDPRKRAESVHNLKKALAKHISIMIFPEGTFNETGAPLRSFYDGAFRIAIETQTPIKPVLFVDTNKRLHYRSLFCLTPGRNRAVFLQQVNVDGLTLHDVGALKQQVYHLMDEGLRRYNTFSNQPQKVAI